MASRFQASLDFVLAREGGYSADKDDRGGATNRGITQRTFDDWRERQGLPTAPVLVISDDEVRAIYLEQYWRPARCNQLKPELDLVMFDTAVNCGPPQAIKFLQRAVGAKDDGVFGPKTLAAVEAEDTDETEASVIEQRDAFYKDLADRHPKQRKFLRGWLARNDKLRGESQPHGGTIA